MALVQWPGFFSSSKTTPLNRLDGNIGVLRLFSKSANVFSSSSDVSGPRDCRPPFSPPFSNPLAPLPGFGSEVRPPEMRGPGDLERSRSSSLAFFISSRIAAFREGCRR